MIVDNCLAALVKLKTKFGKCAKESSAVRTVCLPPPQQSLQPGFTCDIAGYGKESHGEESPLSIVLTSDRNKRISSMSTLKYYTCK